MNVGQFQGRLAPKVVPVDERAATKLKELEINVSMIQLKLFLDHKESILNQAEAIGLPLYDCFVRFDLCHRPPLPLVGTKKIDAYYYTPEEKKGFEASRSKENITCIFTSPIFDGSLVEGRIPTLGMLRLFPHEWLSSEQKMTEM